MMQYKGYIGKIEFDEQADIFHGEVINLRDVITFQGKTTRQLKKAFRDSIDDYLDFCAKRGESPEKPYSGKFIVRIEPELHKTVATRASLSDKSLNAWVHDVLAEACHQSVDK
ncbi:MAG: toxin-antitoxin system HicB family antitoxin [Planctomycetes bacterium B3_Pla]|nr:MAG: toxin-antitoxin system HicB family antitoxin [Planctomycetes bacterium B3_Pla]